MSAILDERNQIDNSSKKKLRGRLTSGTVALLIALLAVISATYAWYVYNTGRHTTKVRMAAGAGDAKPIQELELSNIDVSAEQKYKDIVFCVYSTKPDQSYNIQLAHTTNIGFIYTIYKASLAPSDGEVSYLKERYKKGNELAGNYLNKGGNGYATNKYHETTYATYTKVQAAAEPLYWRTTNKETLPGSVHNGNYINYYILHISWDKDVQDNKETDMVYLMAG